MSSVKMEDNDKELSSAAIRQLQEKEVSFCSRMYDLKHEILDSNQPELHHEHQLFNTIQMQSEEIEEEVADLLKIIDLQDSACSLHGDCQSALGRQKFMGLTSKIASRDALFELFLQQIRSETDPTTPLPIASRSRDPLRREGSEETESSTTELIESPVNSIVTSISASQSSSSSENLVVTILQNVLQNDPSFTAEHGLATVLDIVHVRRAEILKEKEEKILASRILLEMEKVKTREQERELHSVRSKLEDAEEEIKTLKQETEHLRDGLLDGQNNREQFEAEKLDMNAVLRRFEGESKKMAEELQIVMKQKEDLETRMVSDMNSQKAETALLKKQMAATEARLLISNGKLLDKDRLIEASKNTQQSLLNQLQSQRSEIDDSNSKFQDLKKAVLDRDEQNKSLARNAKSMDFEMRRLTSEIKSIRGQIHQIQTANSNLNEEKTRMEQELSTLKRRCENLISSIGPIVAAKLDVDEPDSRKRMRMDDHSERIEANIVDTEIRLPGQPASSAVMAVSGEAEDNENYNAERPQIPDDEYNHPRKPGHYFVKPHFRMFPAKRKTQELN